MSKKQHPIKPTDGELEILAVLWQAGPSTVRQVFEVIRIQRDIGYTTVLKLLQIMTNKGLVDRDESQRSHVYRPRAAQSRTQRQLVRDLMERAFGGSAQTLIMQALSAKPTTQREITELRKLITQWERNRK